MTTAVTETLNHDCDFGTSQAFSRLIPFASLNSYLCRPLDAAMIISKRQKKQCNRHKSSFLARLAGSGLRLGLSTLRLLLANDAARNLSVYCSLSRTQEVILYTYRPVVWPAADLAAVLAFSAFFALSLCLRFSLPSLTAWARAAERASGRWERRSLITSREAPTTARWALTCLRRRVLAASCGGCEWSVLLST